MATPPRTRRARSAAKSAAPAAGAREYVDFVLAAERVDAGHIRVRVVSSPAGAMKTAVRVPYPDAEARALRASFQIGSHAGTGRMLISQDEATRLGKRLAEVLLPPAVFRLLAQGFSRLAGDEGRGLRVRLALDPTLIDLPWEYLYRPDRSAHTGVSGFLLFDPAVSLVRLKARPRLVQPPITGSQRLNFIGAYWEGRKDGWEVWREFDQLRSALKPVARYIRPEFAVAADLDVFDSGIEEDTALFHYAGHVDFDSRGRAFCVREMPATGRIADARKVWLTDLARTLKGTRTRVAVMSACNSGFWPAVEPLVRAGVPVVVGINGAVASVSTIEFCTRLYESLALGLGIDEAVGRARRATMEWGARNDLFDWGLYMVYAQTPSTALFPRAATPAVAARQTAVRDEHREQFTRSLVRVRELDGMNFGQIMSELTRRRVLILGRFSKRRLPVLEAIKTCLAAHPNGYLPELFTFKRPDSRDLVESILGFAALSRFVIADLSEPRSIPQELQAIVPAFQSVPIVPIINAGGREFATFAALARRPNVAQPTLRYKGVDELVAKLESEVVPTAEALKLALQPPA